MQTSLEWCQPRRYWFLHQDLILGVVGWIEIHVGHRRIQLRVLGCATISSFLSSFLDNKNKWKGDSKKKWKERGTYGKLPPCWFVHPKLIKQLGSRSQVLSSIISIHPTPPDPRSVIGMQTILDRHTLSTEDLVRVRVTSLLWTMGVLRWRRTDRSHW